MQQLFARHTAQLIFVHLQKRHEIAYPVLSSASWLMVIARANRVHQNAKKRYE